MENFPSASDTVPVEEPLTVILAPATADPSVDEVTTPVTKRV